MTKKSKIAIIKNNASDQKLLKSIQLLKDVLDNSLDVDVKIENLISSDYDFYFIILDSNKFVKKVNGFGEECFAIEQKESNKIFFDGYDDLAISNALTTFVEQVLEFNYLYPLDEFKSYKKFKKLNLENVKINECPTFLQRQLSPIKVDSKGTIGDFALVNKLNEKIDFHHSFNKLLNKTSIIKNNEDFFPIIKGKRYLPKDSKDYNWQPNFNSEILIDTLVNLFLRNQNQNKLQSVSLSINDSGNFDESEKSMDFKHRKLNFLKKVNFSNDYYTFVNSVATKIEHQNLKVGVLAYSSVIEPPSFNLNKNVITFITSDKMRWGNSELKLLDQNLTKSWLNVSKQIGIYDYSYGSYYLIPRLYTKTIKNYFNWAQEMNIKYYYSESYYNFTEGSKVWVLSKLLWNSNYDVDSLNRIWNVHVFGSKSSKLLKKYFDNWENFWDGDVKNSSWYTNVSQYLPFNDLDYLTFVDTNLFLNNIKILNKALKKAKTEFHKKNITYYIQFNEIQFAIVKLIKSQGSNQKTISRLKSDEEFLKLVKNYFEIFDNNSTFSILNKLIEK